MLFGANKERRFDGHSPTSPRWIITPHMRTHMNFQITLCGKRFCAHVTLERFVASVGSNVDLKGTGTGELFLTDTASVLWR